MISETRLSELTYKAAEIAGIDHRYPNIQVGFVHTPDKNSIKYTISNVAIELDVSDWIAEMDEDTFVALMVFFFDLNVNFHRDAEMPKEVREWTDANRHKWTGVSA